MVAYRREVKLYRFERGTGHWVALAIKPSHVTQLLVSHSFGHH